MKGKIISCVPAENDFCYRVEIFEDESCTELVGEANVIGSGSFSRDRQLMNKALIKRYAKSVANRRGPSFPWFISDELAHNSGITIELPAGMSSEMKPSAQIQGKKHQSNNTNGNSQMGIDDYFVNSSMGFLADERSVSPPPPQFNFPCDDAIVPIELIDSDLKYPDLVPVNQFISDSSLMTRSLSIWAFCQTFSDQLKLSPFSYDDWEEAVTCSDPQIDSNPMVEETFLALLFTLMKDRRNLTKGAFADRIKSAVLTFKSELPIPEDDSEDENNADTEDVISKNPESEGPEIVISSDSDASDEESTFVKRSKNSKKPIAKKTKTLILPSIDLRKHRWYETRATEYWHFVLGAFFHEIIDMVAQFAAEERAKDESGSESSGEESSGDEVGVEDGNDSAYEEESSEDGATVPKDNTTHTPTPTLTLVTTAATISPLEAMQTFIKVYEPIIEELTEKGSKEMYTSYLNLSLSHKLALLEFLIHSHHDRDAFKLFVEECLESQGESKRLRNEIEGEAQEVFGEVEQLEGKVEGLKEENAKISERLEADESDIEMSGSEDEGTKPTAQDTSKTPVVPLSEKERDELVQKRLANKKEINILNANLRKLRPEATTLNRKLDAANRDLRKCSSFRTLPLGTDRHSREYWWFGDFNVPLGRILLFDPERSTWVGAIDNDIGFKGLMKWLNPLGIREAKLKAALMEIEKEVYLFLASRDLPASMTLVTADPEPTETTPSTKAIVVPSDSEEVDFDSFRRGRGRPSKASVSSASINIPAKRPFQKYKNTL